MVQRRFKKATPFLVLSAIGTFLLIAELLIERGGPDGWLNAYALRLFLLILGMLAIDFALKYFIRNKTWLLWVVELFLCLCLVYYWIIS